MRRARHLWYTLALCFPPVIITTAKSARGGRYPDSTNIEMRKDARQAPRRAFLSLFAWISIFPS
jgi:hypothetical protein